ncbi:hypothetical protein [Desulfospira joergensenii]|uniref:hypothetical protein n=1 Tax=Desulfospira joergensenii TaxID=53329 RepID=UPI0003B2F5D9|nr:hypothetical protein [Desulfospira joergensenii]
MNTQLIITVSIVLGLLFLFFISAMVFSKTRRNLDRIIQERFNKEELIGATTRSNFFGIKSRGGAQIRGNGALVLTKDAIYSIRSFPRNEFKIPIHSIRSVSMPKAFNGKSVFVPLLCVNFDTGYGEDSIAWALKDARKWKEAIEKMTT